MQAQPGQYLSFNLEALTYAVPISSVREINRVMPITPIPETPAYVAGVMNLRGRVIPVVDLRIRLGLSPTEHTRHTCVIVVDSNKGQTGLLVDRIQGVVTLQGEHIAPRPQLTDPKLTFVSGMGKLADKVLILVEVNPILSNNPVESGAQAA